MKKPRKRNEEDLNFWQPASDMFSALLLILMLVIVMLGLYLIQIPEFDQPDPDLGDTYEGSPSPAPTNDWDWSEGHDPGGSDGDGGGGETPHPTFVGLYGLSSPTVTPTVTPPPRTGNAGGNGGGEGGGEGAGEGPGDDPDVGLKSAVYVMVIDAETERSIKEPGVQFEVYSDNHALQVLNVYYPERLSFRFYETTENGSFYLPEKLIIGQYELHELTEPTGYDASPNVTFMLNETFDWADPLVVEVPVYPSRNIIRVQMTDMETGLKIPGGTFDIFAADNIITLDGTLRYRLGQKVGEIVCDENGYGESEELYLADYILRQVEAPEFYSSYPEEVTVTVEKKAALPPNVHYFPSEKTRINIIVSDELYDNRVIANAEFSITPSDGLPFTAVSDHLGKIRLEGISKNAVYRIRQTSSSGGYRIDPAEYSVMVSSDGRIDGEPSKELNLTNRIIRVSIGVADEFSSTQIAGINISLYDMQDTLLHTWTTSGVMQSYTDLEPGNYYAVMDTGTENRYEINVRDQAEIQVYTILTSYLLHYLLFGSIALVVILIIVIVLIVVLRKRKIRKEQQGEGGMSSG